MFFCHLDANECSNNQQSHCRINAIQIKDFDVLVRNSNKKIIKA